MGFVIISLAISCRASDMIIISHVDTKEASLTSIMRTQPDRIQKKDDSDGYYVLRETSYQKSQKGCPHQKPSFLPLFPFSLPPPPPPHPPSHWLSIQCAYWPRTPDRLINLMTYRCDGTRWRCSAAILCCYEEKVLTMAVEQKL
jgi:hypothetical protein